MQVDDAALHGERQLPVRDGALSGQQVRHHAQDQLLQPDARWQVSQFCYINTFEILGHKFEFNFDFRSFLDTVGERTFEIKSWGTKDGYSTATVNWLESTDTAETEEEAAECAQKARN